MTSEDIFEQEMDLLDLDLEDGIISYEEYVTTIKTIAQERELFYLHKARDEAATDRFDERYRYE